MFSAQSNWLLFGTHWLWGIVRDLAFVIAILGGTCVAAMAAMSWVTPPVADPTQPLPRMASPVFTVSFDPTARKLSVLRQYGVVSQIDLATGAQSRSQWPKTMGNRLCWNATNSVITRVTEAGGWERFDVTRELVQELAPPGNDRVGLGINAEGTLGVSLSEHHRQVDVWEVDDAGTLSMSHFRLSGTAPFRFGILDRAGEQFYAIDSTGDQRLVDPRTGESRIALSVRPIGPNAAAFSENGRWLVMHTISAGQLTVCSTQDGTAVFDQHDPEGTHAVAITNDGHWLICSSSVRNTLRLFDLIHGTVVESQVHASGPTRLISTLTIDEQQQRAYSGAMDGSLHEWQLPELSLIRELE